MAAHMKICFTWLAVLVGLHLMDCYSYRHAAELFKEQCRRNGPRFWCRDEKTAKLCMAFEYCQSYRMSLDSPQKADDPVKMTLYMESLCPDCQRYITKILYPAFEKLYPTGIWDLRVIPFGNAKEYSVGDKYAFKCQHGPEECHGNVIQTCALHQLNITAAMQFINCLEVTRADDVNAKKCASTQKIDFHHLMKCVNGSEGNLLEHKMAQLTNSLIPKHTFVPWVTINGNHTKEIQHLANEDTVKLICDNYKGKKPQECKQEHKPVALEEKNNFV